MRSAARLMAIEEQGLTPEGIALARSVVYASLFDYPLTLAQLRRTLIASAQTPSQILATYRGSAALRHAIEFRDGFFFLRGRGDLIAERREREERSRQFLVRHRLLLRVVGAMPYVRMAALSGSIAHMNLEGTGDLDLFIVTRGRHVWSVTVAVLLLSKLMRRRRVVCANFVVADSRLVLEQQDLFTASQIIHLKPLIGRDVYRSLLEANPFVFEFYPNLHDAEAAPASIAPGRIIRLLKRTAEVALIPAAAAAEYVCRSAYRWYLRRRASGWRSPEQVRLRDDYLKLHTQSHRRSVLDRFDHEVESVLHST